MFDVRKNSSRFSRIRIIFESIDLLPLFTNRKNIIILISIIYLVGLIGLLLSSTKALFQELIPINIFFSFLLVLYFHHKIDIKLLSSFLIIFFLGFFLEVAGVSTGTIFGSYYYQSFLGPKVLGVPLLIGFNWFLLVYCASTIFIKFQNNIYVYALFVAIAMLVLDIALEFFAIQNQMWIWTDTGLPPFKNFIAWFIAAYVFAYIYKKVNVTIEENKIANAVFYIMFLFFLIFDLINYFIVKQIN